MAILQECCRIKYSLKKEKCPKCGTILTTKKPKRYWIDYRHNGAQKREFIGSDRRLAETVLAKRIAAIREEKFLEKPKSLPLKEVAEFYLRHSAHQTQSKTVKYIWDNLLKEWGHLKSDQITTTMIEELKSKMLDEGKGERWIDYHLQIARSAYNLLKFPNPFAEVKLFKPDTRIVRYLTPDERIHIVNLAKKHGPRYFWEILIISLQTGLRRKDVLRLRRDEVNFEYRVIRVFQKPRKWHTVPMSDDVYSILLNISDNGTSYFWINPKTGKPYQDLKKSWIKLKEKAGITRTFRWHDLRHDFLSQIVRKTGSLKIAQELAGHSDPRQTDVYAHLIDDDLRHALDLLPSVDSFVDSPEND